LSPCESMPAQRLGRTMLAPVNLAHRRPATLTAAEATANRRPRRGAAMSVNQHGPREADSAVAQETFNGGPVRWVRRQRGEGLVEQVLGGGAPGKSCRPARSRAHA